MADTDRSQAEAAVDRSPAFMSGGGGALADPHDLPAVSCDVDQFLMEDLAVLAPLTV